MNWENNPEERLYGRFTQRFGSQEGDEESASNIKNAYYISADYTKTDFERRNPNHGDDLFRYGHVGSFKEHKERFYVLTTRGRQVISCCV